MYNDSSSSYYYYYYYYYHDCFYYFYHYRDHSTMIFCFLLYSLRGATHMIARRQGHGQQEKQEGLEKEVKNLCRPLLKRNGSRLP